MFVESNKHLFWECHISRGFWTEIQMFLNLQIDINLNYEFISFGYMDQSSYTTLLNCILIFAKFQKVKLRSLKIPENNNSENRIVGICDFLKKVEIRSLKCFESGNSEISYSLYLQIPKEQQTEV